MTFDDFAILTLILTVAITLRWMIFNGPEWGKTLLKLLIIPAVMTGYKLMRLDFVQETLILLGFFVFVSICIWLAKWPTNWLMYAFKVIRGAAKTAKRKADAMAEVE